MVFTTIQTIQEQKKKEQCKDREEQRTQCEHNQFVLEMQMVHECVKMDHEFHKMQLEIELQHLKIQECAIEHGVHSGEGNKA